MEFGRVKNPDEIDFALPPDAIGTAQLLARQNIDNERLVYVGCPVWGVKEWVGSYYPAQAKEKDFLQHYTCQFNTIELNSTHYHTPSPETVRKWKEVSAEGFKFCPKLPQSISHERQLQHVEPLMDEFCLNIKGLDEKLGVCFLQLPPYFSPAGLPVLEAFLKRYSAEIMLAVEFRHEDFFKPPHFDKAFDILEKYKASSVLTDVAGRRDVLHQRLTNDTVLVRWVGEQLHPTDFVRLDMWVEKLSEWIRKGLGTVYFFIHQSENITSPDLARYFLPKLNETLGLNLRPPRLYAQVVQGSLF
jgi:uncharacterized protein YecE (DUF72 family)